MTGRGDHNALVRPAGDPVLALVPGFSAADVAETCTVDLDGDRRGETGGRDSVASTSPVIRQ